MAEGNRSMSLVETVTKMEVVEYNGEPVVTFRMVDQLHDRPDGTAGRNFRAHREKMMEGVDYWQVEQVDEIRRLGLDGRGSDPILLTESGYLMLVKSFRDDLAWQVQRTLVNHYFRSKSQIQSRDDYMRHAGRELLAGIREGLNEHFKPVNQRLDRVESGLAEVRDELHRVVRRRELTAATRRQHTDTLMWLGGKCPCCGKRDVIDEYGNRLPNAHWEHFYAPHRNAACETWLTCSQCNEDMKDHRVRVQREPFFKAYQLRREERHMPLLKPFDQ